MTGIIEDEDPGASGFQIHAFVTVADSAGDMPTLDVESFVDGLRFMGLDRELVDEADRRLRTDPGLGMRWLEQRLKEREPPREPPTCICGEVLVDVSWRGRATVRCSVCGSRWGVDVVDEETESLWAVSGPTAEWIAGQATEERFRYDEFSARGRATRRHASDPGWWHRPGDVLPCRNMARRSGCRRSLCPPPGAE